MLVFQRTPQLFRNQCMRVDQLTKAPSVTSFLSAQLHIDIILSDGLFRVTAAIIWVEMIKPNKSFKDYLKRLLIRDKTKMLTTSFDSFELRLLRFYF